MFTLDRLRAILQRWSPECARYYDQKNLNRLYTRNKSKTETKLYMSGYSKVVYKEFTSTIEISSHQAETRFKMILHSNEKMQEYLLKLGEISDVIHIKKIADSLKESLWNTTSINAEKWDEKKW